MRDHFFLFHPSNLTVAILLISYIVECHIIIFFSLLVSPSPTASFYYYKLITLFGRCCCRGSQEDRIWLNL